MKPGTGRLGAHVLGEDAASRILERHLLDAGDRLRAFRNEGQRLVVLQPVAVVEEAVIEEPACWRHRRSSSNRLTMKSAMAFTSSRPNTGTGQGAIGPLAATAITEGSWPASSGWPSVGIAHLDLGVALALVAFGDDEIRVRELGDDRLERRFRLRPKLVHQRPAVSRYDRHLPGAGLAVAPGIAPFVIDVEGMVGMLDGRDAVASLDEFLDQALGQGRLARILEPDDAQELSASRRERVPDAAGLGQVFRPVGIEEGIVVRGGKVDHRQPIAAGPLVDLADVVVDERLAQIVFERHRPQADDRMRAAVRARAGEIGAAHRGPRP